jgi:hypothetical protein
MSKHKPKSKFLTIRPKVAKPKSLQKAKPVRRPTLSMPTGRPAPAWLKPIQRGEVRNPKGIRPPGPTVLTQIKALLEQKDPDDEKGRTYGHSVAMALIKQAKNGSFIHTKEIIDRQEGKVAQKVEVSDGTDTKMYINVPVEGDEAP